MDSALFEQLADVKLLFGMLLVLKQQFMHGLHFKLICIIFLFFLFFASLTTSSASSAFPLLLAE